MYRFHRHVIRPILEELHCRHLVEIGSDRGYHTRLLLDYCRDRDAVLHAVDPDPKYDVNEWIRDSDGRLRYHRSTSLEAIPKIDRHDAVFVDGDHNWYTVLHELRALERNCLERSIPFPIVFLHDVGWPYGRRDLYYVPERVDPRYRQPYRTRGMTLDSPELLDEGGLNTHLCNAIYENTLRNGVLTAVEDFLAESGRPLSFDRIPGLHDLGILSPVHLRRERPGFAKILDERIPGDAVSDWIDQIERCRLETEIRCQELRRSMGHLSARMQSKMSRLAEDLERTSHVAKRETQRAADLEASNEALEAEKSRTDTTLAALRSEIDTTRAAGKDEVERLREELAKRDEELDSARRDLEADRSRGCSVEADDAAGKVELHGARLRRTEQDLGRLNSLFDELRRAIRRLLHSKRWILGNRIGNVHRTMLRKKAATLPPDEIETVLRKYEDWHLERKRRREDDAPVPMPHRRSKGVPGHFATRSAGILPEASSRPPVPILIYSDHRLDHLRDCLTSLEGTVDTDRNPVTVIDDSGEAGIAERIRYLAAGIGSLSIVRHRTSRGFSASVATALGDIAGGDAFVATNRVVFTPGWLESLGVCADRVTNAGIVAPLTPCGPYARVDLAPGDGILGAAAKIRCLADPQHPVTPLPDLDAFLVRRALLDGVPLPQQRDGDAGATLARWILDAHRSGFVTAIADDAYVHVRKARDAEELHAIRQSLSVDDAAYLARIEKDSDAPEIDVTDRYARSDMRLVGSRTAAFFVETDGESGLDPEIADLADRLHLLEVDVKLFLVGPGGRTLAPPSPERLVAPLPFEDEEQAARNVPEGAHVFATGARSAAIVQRIRERVPGIHGAYLPRDLERIVPEPDAPEDRASEVSVADAARHGLGLLVTSDWMRSRLLHLTRDPDLSVRKVPAGVDLDRFRPPSNEADPNGSALPRRLLLVTRPTGGGTAECPETSRILDAIRARLPEIEIERITDASMESWRAALVRADIVADTVSRQGIHRTALRAMASGRPAVLVNGGGIWEFAANEENCLVVEPGRPEELAEALDRLCRDADLRERIRQGGLGTAASHGDLSLARDIATVIESHAARRRAVVKKLAEDVTCNIVIPVHNELEFVRICLESVVRHTRYPYRVIVVNDASDSHTTEYLREFAAAHETVQVLENEMNLGFVGSCNRGMAAAPSGDILLLNSDVIVTPGWLRKIATCAHSDPAIGLVSPMSTRSSHLWIKINPGDNVFSTARKIEDCSDATYPDIVTPEGWCFFIKRECYEHLGEFDPVFGKGYCEESDYSMRALCNGWRTVCADDTFLFHKGRVTFKGERGPRYKANRAVFDARWDPYYKKLYPRFLEGDPLGYLRERYAATRRPGYVRRDDVKKSAYPGVLQILDDSDLPRTLEAYRRIASRHEEEPLNGSVPQRVVFLLATLEKYGGVISVTQLANDLILQGIDARIFVLNPKRFAEDLFLLTEPVFFESVDSMIAAFPEEGHGVATLWVTMYYLARIVETNPRIVPHYFIQDYEPDFYDLTEPELRQKVADTYTLPARRFAKTRWIIDKVAAHGVRTRKVPPGLHLDVFYPRDVAPHDGVRLVTMMRPKTKRRGFDTLKEVIPEILRRHPGVELHAFGTPDEELRKHPVGFPFVNHGPLAPGEVARLYSDCDIYLDLSSFQGFGRTGLEAMACGTACMLTRSGGVSEYAVDGENCLLAKPEDKEAIVDAVDRMIRDADLRARLVQAGRETVARFEKTYSSRKTWETLSDTDGAAETPAAAVPGAPRGVRGKETPAQS